MSVPRILLTLVCVCIMSWNLCAQECGCTDPLAINYNPSATLNDGSCLYADQTIQPVVVGALPQTLNGTSALIWWQGNFWTYNDHNNQYLYQLDTLSGIVRDSILVSEFSHQDLEEVQQDADYLYFGDIGNDGSRQNLCILRCSKNELLSGSIPVFDTIFFQYADQLDFNSTVAQTDFDCEAFVVAGDSIYLFTKQWTTQGTDCYVLPATPGSHVAQKRGSLDVQGLVTGACYDASRKVLVLCGYNLTLTPFVFLLYDFQEHDFFAANKRKITMDMMATQTEAIATSNGLTYYLTNEQFSYSVVQIPPQLLRVDFTPYLSNYYEHLTNVTSSYDNVQMQLWPNPARDYCRVTLLNEEIAYVRLCSMSGICLQTFPGDGQSVMLALQDIPDGVYVIHIQTREGKILTRKLIVAR